MGHSKIGPSSSDRTFACPAWVRLSEGSPEQESSPYAEYGTKLHDLAAKHLEHGGNPAPGADADIIQPYIDFCRGLVEANADVAIERKVGIPEIDSQLWGSLDFGLYHFPSRAVHIVDLKTGAGKFVEAEGNLQLLTYAGYFAWGRPVKSVKLTIVQPRMPSGDDGGIRTVEVSPLALVDIVMQWAEIVGRVADPTEQPNPGDHCRWCPAAAVCPALRDKATLVARGEFGTFEAVDTETGPCLVHPRVDEYRPHEIAEALRTGPQLEAWIEAVHAVAYSEAKAGAKIPGYKLVAKPEGDRKYADPETARAELEAWATSNGKNPDNTTEPRKLKSPAQIEKTFGAKIKPLVATLVTRAASNGSVLVPVSDKRPEITSAAESEFEKLPASTAGEQDTI